MGKGGLHEVKIFLFSNVSIQWRTEQTDATHTYHWGLEANWVFLEKAI